MAIEKVDWGIKGLDQERIPREFSIVDSGASQVGRRTGRYGAKAKPGKGGSARTQYRAPEIQGGPDAVQDRQGSPAPIKEEDRTKARDILTDIGNRFAENRKKGKSNAFEEYQRDIALNMNYLIMGGALTLKDCSQLLMQLEEYRKQTSEHGKTPSTLLAEWLSGGAAEPS